MKRVHKFSVFGIILTILTWDNVVTALREFHYRFCLIRLVLNNWLLLLLLLVQFLVQLLQ